MPGKGADDSRLLKSPESGATLTHGICQLGVTANPNKSDLAVRHGGKMWRARALLSYTPDMG